MPVSDFVNLPAPDPARPAIDVPLLAALAREIAMEINPLQMILLRYGLTESQYQALRKNPTFKKILDGARAAWTSASNAPERIRIEAAAAFEHLMPIISKRLASESEGLDDVVRGARMIADVAGLIAPPVGGGGERVTINIDLGADQKLTMTHDVKPVEVVESDLAVVKQAAAALPKGG